MTLKNRVKAFIAQIISLRGYEIQSIKSEVRPIEYEEEDNLIWETIKSETMASFSNFWFLLKSIDYLVENNIRGSVVECGVWRGGSSMAVALRLVQKGSLERDIYLFDTFNGMVLPSSQDIDTQTGLSASDLLNNAPANSWILAKAALSVVQENIYRTHYPETKIHYIVGDVLETLPTTNIESIALLRLDTDWYESTLAELKYLLPRLVKGGICIIDDYGHWDGCKKAVQEYFSTSDFKPLLFHVDYTCRAFIRV